MNSYLRFCGIALLSTALCGCAHSYTDANGNRHVIGLVNLSMPPASKEPASADWLRLRAFGIAFSHNEFSSSLNIGYSDNLVAAIRNNSCAYFGAPPFAELSPNGEDDARHTKN